jgi:hypothetical protein
MRVRCVVLPLVAVMLLCSVSAASLHYGVKGGLSLATQDFDYSSGWSFDVSYRSGLAAGVFVERGWGSGFGVLAEVLYVQKGMEFQVIVTDPDDPEATGTRTVAERLDYVSLSVLLKKKVDFEGWDAYGAAGPRFDFMLGYDAEGGFDSVYDDFSDFDVGADVAIGADIGRLLVEVRYSPTFTKSYQTDLLEVTNSGLEVLGGVRF